MAKRRKRGGLATIAELVPGVYPSNEPDDIVLVRAIGWWDRHVPARIARSVRPAQLRRGTLWIHAVTGAWAQEVTMMLPRWKPGLMRALPALKNANVRVKVGPLPPRPVLAPRPEPIPPLTIGELPETVARALAGIPNDDVRDAVAKAASQSLAERPLAERPLARRPLAERCPR